MRPTLQRRARGPTPFSSPEPPDFLGSVASPGRAPAPLRANNQDTSANLALRPAPPRLQQQLGRYQLIGGMGWRGGGASQARVERARTCTSPGCKASQAGCAVLFGCVGAAGSSAPVLPGSPPEPASQWCARVAGFGFRTERRVFAAAGCGPARPWLRRRPLKQPWRDGGAQGYPSAVLGVVPGRAAQGCGNIA